MIWLILEKVNFKKCVERSPAIQFGHRVAVKAGMGGRGAGGGADPVPARGVADGRHSAAARAARAAARAPHAARAHHRAQRAAARALHRAAAARQDIRSAIPTLWRTTTAARARAS